VSASIGVAVAPEDGDVTETLLQHADVALHLAKGSPASIARYDAARDPSSLARLAMVNDLRDAIDNGELDVVFQPQADLRTGRVVAAEALVRWEHPTHGRVPPDVFVPLAEHAGLIRPLTRHVIRRALAARRRWADEGSDIRVSVNLSVRDLLDAQLPVEVTAELLASRTPPAALVLEITETSVMVDPARTRAVLERLHELGIGLAVDDFGTGYSSLAYLKVLPVDEVKIDRAFVSEVATDDSDAAIVRSVVDLGRNLGLRVVAEGVEDEPGWQRLRELGCDMAQGYLLCRPIPAGEMAAWLDRRREPAPLASPHGRPAGADRGALGASRGALG
jgi:predicted signal transduction protein with EAL and GGDEF domain